jgi:hypothetical protein
MRLSWAQLWHQRVMRSMRTSIVTMKLIRMHVGGVGLKMWFGVLVFKGKSITSINMHEHLTFMKHIYIDVNADVIAVKLRFVQQDWAGLVGTTKVDPSSYSSRIYSLFLICCSFSLRHVSCRTDNIRLVIRCLVIHASYCSWQLYSNNLLSSQITSFWQL